MFRFGRRCSILGGNKSRTEGAGNTDRPLTTVLVLVGGRWYV